MILVHEDMQKEAEHVASRLQEVYNIPAFLVNQDLKNLFTPIQSFPGFFYSHLNLKNQFFKEFHNNSVFVLTSRDLYIADKDRNDDWIFGYRWANLTVVTNARMKRKDSQPSSDLQIPFETYLKRLDFLSIHEVGHDLVKAKHHKNAQWVNVKTNYTMELGQHCTDNKCVMYEIVDIKAPPISEGHMLLGDEKRYDAGLDDLLERIYPDWFCSKCREAISVS